MAYKKLRFKIDPSTKTVVIRNKYGKLEGRRRTKSGEKSDGTKIRRVSSGPREGEIFGRTVSGSSRSRGYIKQLTSLR